MGTHFATLVAPDAARMAMLVLTLMCAAGSRAGLSVFLLAIAVVLMIAATFARSRWRTDVTADLADGLSIDGRPVASRESITRIQVRRRRRTVTFTHASGKTTLAFRSVAAMNDALNDLEVSETAPAVLVVDGTRIVLGADGIRLGRKLYPFSEITSTSRDGEALALHTTRGTIVRIYLGGLSRIVAERVRRAIESRDALPAADALDRRSREALTWARDLRVSADTATYRRPGLSPEDLWKLAEAPGAAPAERASAAVALSSEPLSNAERDRLRVMATSTLNEPVARTFLRVADDANEEALAEGLAEFESADEAAATAAMRARSGH